MFITFKSFPQLIYFLFIYYKTAVLRILFRIVRYVSKSIRWKREYCKRFFMILWFFWSRFDYKIHQISYIFISIIYTLISQDYNMYIFRVHRTMYKYYVRYVIYHLSHMDKNLGITWRYETRCTIDIRDAIVLPLS